MYHDLLIEYVASKKEIRAVYFNRDEETGGRYVVDITGFTADKVSPSNFALYSLKWDNIKTLKIVDDCGHTFVTIEDEDSTGIATLNVLRHVAEFVALFKLHAKGYKDCENMVVAPEDLCKYYNTEQRDLIEAYLADDPLPMSPYVYLAE